ncbi:hypothetical protein H072_1944 [Dactylellina haptotyla CBS 200.50]|uniref:Uncharacterized protein n=1 Tax=Dactylellina haptotyla (strain CBS 200.50) TaxID=1284197 RepID=S8AMH7_DACHA|nr:hypothetical protein H072_1944 [Dactylellina haptotyla CBS 200.50]
MRDTPIESLVQADSYSQYKKDPNEGNVPTSPLFCPSDDEIASRNPLGQELNLDDDEFEFGKTEWYDKSFELDPESLSGETLGGEFAKDLLLFADFDSISRALRSAWLSTHSRYVLRELSDESDEGSLALEMDEDDIGTK